MHDTGGRDLSSPDRQVRLNQRGVEPWPMTPDAMDALVKPDGGQCRPVKTAGIKQ